MGESGLHQGFPKQVMKCWEEEVKKRMINSASNISTILYVRGEGMNSSPGREAQGRFICIVPVYRILKSKCFYS